MSIEHRAQVLINELGLSQKELEAESGISHQSWSRVSNGRQKLKSDHLEFLCNKLPQFTTWLMTGDQIHGLTPENTVLYNYFEQYAEVYSRKVAIAEYAIKIRCFNSNRVDLPNGDCISLNDPIDVEMFPNKNDALYQELMQHGLQECRKLANKQDRGDGIKHIVQRYFMETTRKRLADWEEYYQEFQKNEWDSIMDLVRPIFKYFIDPPLLLKGGPSLDDYIWETDDDNERWQAIFN